MSDTKDPGSSRTRAAMEAAPGVTRRDFVGGTLLGTGTALLGMASPAALRERRRTNRPESHDGPQGGLDRSRRHRRLRQVERQHATRCQRRAQCDPQSRPRQSTAHGARTRAKLGPRRRRLRHRGTLGLFHHQQGASEGQGAHARPAPDLRRRGQAERVRGRRLSPHGAAGLDRHRGAVQARRRTRTSGQPLLLGIWVSRTSSCSRSPPGMSERPQGAATMRGFRCTSVGRNRTPDSIYEGKGWVKNPWRNGFRDAPLSEATKKAFVDWDVYRTPPEREDWEQWLDSMTYEQFMRDEMGLERRGARRNQTYIDPVAAAQGCALGPTSFQRIRPTTSWCPASFLLPPCEPR